MTNSTSDAMTDSMAHSKPDGGLAEARRSEQVTEPSAWTGSDLEDDSGWQVTLTSNHQRELESALATVLALGRPAVEITKTDFPLPELSPLLEKLQDDADNGRGVVLIRGVPVEHYSIEENEYLAAGICAHLGTLVVQNKSGTLIGHVRDVGLSQKSISVPGYKTREESVPHCDTGDLLGLLCLQTAKSGGMNGISSSMTIYNHILAHHPEYLETLHRGYQFNIRGNGPPGRFTNVTAHRVPVYDYYKGRLSCRFHQQAIKTAEKWPDVEPISDLDKEAIDYIASLAMNPEVRHDFYLRRGDLLLMNNHTVLHTRSSFEDYEELERKRLLLRLWINLPNGRPLRDEFADHYNTGPREGPFVRTVEEDC